MKTRISGKEAMRVAEDMAKPGPIRVVEPMEVQEAPGALVPSAGSELDRKVPVSESLCLVMTNGRHPRPTWKDIDKGCARRSATLCRMNSST